MMAGTPTQREEPVKRIRRRPSEGTERDLLQGHLDYLRDTLIWKLDGLDSEQASRRLVPSLTTLLGIVKHSTDTQAWWFRVIMNGEEIPLTYYTENDPDADWRIEPHDGVHTVVASYRRACDAADQAVAQYSLDDVAHGQGYTRTLRWIYLHMIDETARHCGHADIVRELTDGLSGE